MPLKELDTEKLYYTMGDVSKMLGVSQSLIRFWEKELGVVQLKKNKKGNRLFTLSDIDKLKAIYVLVKQKGYTLQGAKNAFSSKTNESVENKTESVINKLQDIRSRLIDLSNDI